MPAGVEDGQTVRMSVGNNELFITFKVESSNYFKRDGPDVHTDCTVSKKHVFKHSFFFHFIAIVGRLV